MYLFFFVGVMWIPSIRSDWVSRYHRELIDRICLGATIDIYCGCGWTWRYEAYSKAPYWKMILMFWRRLESFYPDLSFADPIVRGPRMRGVEELLSTD